MRRLSLCSSKSPLPCQSSGTRQGCWNSGWLERGHSLRVQGRLWRRLPEPVETDDNPRISDFVGRAEVAAHWDATPNDTLGFVGRHSLARINRGSARIEWLRRVGGNTSTGLRFHTQLFNGYGDSLLDYNRRRTVLSMGLSLVDW